MDDIRILSIDGGGIRGILPGEILVSLEKKIQDRTGDPNSRIADHFDLIAGTSTGGILACGYLCPDENGRPKFSAQEAVDLYMNRGGEIFNKGVMRRIATGFGLADEEYSAEGLEEALRDNFGDVRLSQLLKPSLIVSYDIERRVPHMFKQAYAKEDPNHDFTLVDVTRATSAAPTYFEPALIKSIGGQEFCLIDGGVMANDPSAGAYAEVTKFEGNPTAKDMVLFSLGTGTDLTPYPHDKVRDFGKLGWVKPAFDIVFNSGPQYTGHVLDQMFGTVADPKYIRIDPSLGRASPDLDNASDDNLKRLQEAGRDAANKYDSILNRVADLVVR